MKRRALKVLGTVALLIVVLPIIAQAQPALVGVDHAFVVQSGSMEPAIPTGSLVYVKDVPAENIQEGDVITFTKSRGAATTTHRVIEKHQADTSVRFETKGDANEEADPEPVYRDEIVGVVIFSVPYLGYLVAFAGTRAGWLALIVVPTALLVITEVWSMWQEATVEDGDENAKPN